MENQFRLLRATRENILEVLAQSSSETLLTIPKEFNNNILWNIFHVMASQQLLIYGLSQTPFYLDKSFIFQFKSGTKPKGKKDLDFVEWAKNNLLLSVKQLSKDYQEGIFGDLKPLKTSYGFEIKSVEQAIYFNNLHESMHYGHIKMLQRLLM